MTGSWSKWLRIPSLAERLRAQGVREDVIAAAERTAFGRQTDRALPALNDLLTKSEGVIRLVEGRHHGAYGLLVLTSRRLVFLPAESARDGQTFMVDLSDVLTVDWQIHRGLGVVEVSAGSGPFIVDKILGNQAESIATGTRQAMSPPPDGPAAHRDPLEQLAELRAMHDAGLIGDAEFHARKQDLFGQI
jgi:predicted component of type VI protein secretion system